MWQPRGTHVEVECETTRRTRQSRERGRDDNKTASLSGKNDVVCFYFYDRIYYKVDRLRNWLSWRRRKMAGKYRRRNSSPSDLLKRIRGQILKFFFFWSIRFSTGFDSLSIRFHSSCGGRSRQWTISCAFHRSVQQLLFKIQWFMVWFFFFPFRLNVISVSLAL